MAESTTRDFKRAGASMEAPINSSQEFLHEVNDDSDADQYPVTIDVQKEKALLRKVDLRLCTIAGILTSLNLLDSGIISSASVTTLFTDLGFSGNQYSVAIFIFTISSIAFQAPSTIAVRFFGPRIWFSLITFAFGVITLCTAFITNWQEMIAMRVLLGMAMSGIYPGLSYLISTWYKRSEQQLRFAFLQSGEVFVLATGSILNFGLQQLHGKGGLAGWQWMFLIQGILACIIGVLTYWWIVDFPENSTKSFMFLTQEERDLAVYRIEKDRGDVEAKPFDTVDFLSHGKDFKVYGFACMFFLLNLVSTGLSYFLPLILQGGLGFSTNEAILLSAPPYYWAIIPAILSSLIGDHYRLRGPVIIFNSVCLIVGFAMLGFATQPTVRYVGSFLATGSYVSNWAALTAYYQNNIAGQWKRVFTAVIVTAFNGAGGIAGSYIFNSLALAVWVCIGSHILMIGCVAAFTLAFWYINRRQSQGKQIIEGTMGFRHTY